MKVLIIFVWSGLDALDSAAIGRWAELHFDPLIKGDQFLLKGNQTTRCDDGVCVADRVVLGYLPLIPPAFRGAAFRCTSILHTCWKQ